MALGDIGIFTPAESAYTRPGAYDEALRADALKRASWLSQMDQFYEQLEESKRQFDKTLAFKTTTRDLELAHSKWKVEQEIGLGKAELAQRSTEFTQDLALRQKMLEEQTKLEREKLGIMRTSTKGGQLHLGRSPEEKAMELLFRSQPAAEPSGPRFISSEGAKGDILSEQWQPQSGEIRWS